MATNINILVSTVLETISDLRGETSTNSDAVRIRAVSNANKDFALRRLWRFYLLPDQTQNGDGTRDYTIGSATYPMRFKGLSEVFVSPDATTEEDERHGIIDTNIYKNMFNRNNAQRMAYEWYDAASDVWKAHINPAPEATDTITYSHFWTPPTLTLTTEYVLCPNPKAIALLASALIHESEDERDTAKEEKNEAEQLILEIQGQDNMPAQNQVYAMGAIENSIQSKSLGSY